jgi:hypothetical protein
MMVAARSSRRAQGCRDLAVQALAAVDNGEELEIA